MCSCCFETWNYRRGKQGTREHVAPLARHEVQSHTTGFLIGRSGSVVNRHLLGTAHVRQEVARLARAFRVGGRQPIDEDALIATASPMDRQCR